MKKTYLNPTIDQCEVRVMVICEGSGDPGQTGNPSGDPEGFAPRHL